MRYDEILGALGDGTRRKILRLIQHSPLGVGDIAERLPVSQPAVSQHLRVLREAGLVEWQAVGARRVYRPSVDGVRALRSYVETLWDDVLDAFKAAQDEAVETNARRE